MMKVFTLKPDESWICDRLAEEWVTNNPQHSVNYLNESEIFWL